MENKYNTTINPFEKEREILELFKGYAPKSYSKTDTGYNWLEHKDSKCIVIENPYYTNNIEILINDMYEFTLYFSDYHTHFFADQSDYDDMIKEIKRILSNKFCAATIKDINEKWFGSCLAEKTEIVNEPQKVFNFVFNKKDFFDHLKKHGYKISCCFWNPVENTEIIKTNRFNNNIMIFRGQ